MKNREIIMRRLERVEGGIEKLQLALRQGNWTMVDEMIQEMRDNDIIIIFFFIVKQ